MRNDIMPAASGPSRRLLIGGSLAAMGLVAGGATVGAGPALAQANAPAAAPGGRQPFNFPGKDPGLVPLGDRPLVAETPEAS